MRNGKQSRVPAKSRPAVDFERNSEFSGNSRRPEISQQVQELIHRILNPLLLCITFKAFFIFSFLCVFLALTLTDFPHAAAIPTEFKHMMNQSKISKLVSNKTGERKKAVPDYQLRGKARANVAYHKKY